MVRQNGLHDYSRVDDDVSAQQATNAKLKARNDQLFAEIDDLNGGQEAIEERARNELSMTRPGETFYRLVPDASKRNRAAGNSRIIDKQARDYNMAATFPGVCAVVPAAGFGRRMQTECLNNISQSVTKRFSSTRSPRCWQTRVYGGWSSPSARATCALANCRWRTILKLPSLMAGQNARIPFSLA